MNDFAPVNIGATPSASAVSRYVRAENVASHPFSIDDADASARLADQVEISPEAKNIERLIANDVVRDDLIAQVKSRIEAGEYNSFEVLNAAIDELASDLS